MGGYSSIGPADLPKFCWEFSLIRFYDMGIGRTSSPP